MKYPHFLAALVGFLAALSPSPAQSVRIVKPTNDTIALGSNVDISGEATGGDPAEKVQVKLGPVTKQAAVTSGKWSVPGVAVPDGLHNIEATFHGKKDVVALTKGSGLAARPLQKVRLLWNTGTDQVLGDIARGTLDAQLTNAQVTTFITGVKARAAASFVLAYQKFNIELTSADGPDVHTVSFLTLAGDIFGQSPFDFGNHTQKQISQIWLGTYRDEMVNHFNLWGPMKKTDDLAARIVDVGEAIARTSAHETGHSLGLVGSGSQADGGWMLGCDGGHSCDAVDISNPPADRFDQGFYIMDPGGKTLNNARIAEALSSQRTLPKRPAVFCPFDQSYLGLIHPKP